MNRYEHHCELLGTLSVINPDARLIDGCLINRLEENEHGVLVAVYEEQEVLMDLQEGNPDWDELAAVEWYDFNIIRSLQYFGKNAPKIYEEDLDEE